MSSTSKFCVVTSLRGGSPPAVRDVLRSQVLSKLANGLWARVIDVYRAGNAAGLAEASEQLLALLADTDTLLSTQRCHSRWPPVCIRTVVVKALLQRRILLSCVSEQWPAARAEALQKARHLTYRQRALSYDTCCCGVLMPNRQIAVRARRGMMLGPRLAQARAAARGPDAAALFEANLRTQLMVWGAGGVDGDSEVSDYANREWGGLISSFYVPR